MSLASLAKDVGLLTPNIRYCVPIFLLFLLNLYSYEQLQEKRLAASL